MKRIFRELLVILAYPALVSFLICCLVFIPMHDSQGQSVVPGWLAGLLTVLGICAFFGIFFFAIWDWDAEPIVPAWQRILAVISRVAAVILLFYPFLILWSYLFAFLWRCVA